MSTTAVRALAAALLVSLVALTGCTPQPGTAATVDGRRISSAELAETIDDLGVLTGGAAPADVLQALIIAPDVVAAAAGAGVGVSSDQAVELLNQVAANNGMPSRDDWSEGAITIAELQLANQSIYSLADGAEIAAGVNETIAGRSIEVNPRYGSFDLASGAVVANAEPWIAQE